MSKGMPAPSLGQLIRHWLYVWSIGQLRQWLGIKVHYKAQYQDYLLSPRWLMLRYLRFAMDRFTCRHPGCHKHTTLQCHHRNYHYKGKRGAKNFLLELLSLETLCDEHHTQDTGKIPPIEGL